MKFLGSLLLFLSTLYGAKIYNFSVKVDKYNFIIGEKIRVIYIFKYPKSKRLAEMNFSEPLFEDFNIIEKKDYNETIKNNSKIIKKIFILTAKRDGNLTIEPAYLDIALFKKNKKKVELGDYKDIDFDYKSFQTKPIHIFVSKLSDDTNLYGDFNISAFVDKKNIKENEVVNLTLKIVSKDEASLKNIGSFKLNIKDKTIYTNPPSLQKRVFTQKFTILSDTNYTIPPFEIKYFNPNLNKIITKQTKPIKIIVKKNKVIDLINKNNHDNKIINIRVILYILVAFICGVIIGIFTLKIFNRKDKKLYDTTLEKMKNAKNPKEILNILISNIDKEEIKDLIKEIENDIYIQKTHKLSNKKIIKKYLQLVN